MRSGKLRERVTLYDLTVGRDAIGGVTEVWGNARERWANMDTVSSREYLAVQGVGEEAVVRFTLRYDSTFAMTSKIVHGGVDYYVRQLRNVEQRDRELEVLATRRKPT